MYVNASNLFLTELILRWPNINLSGEWILISWSPFFASLISFSVADLWKTVSSDCFYSIMTSSFLIHDILRKECEEPPTGHMLNNLFYFLKLLKGIIRSLDGNQISAPVKWGKKTRYWLENQASSSSPLYHLWTFLK